MTAMAETSLAALKPWLEAQPFCLLGSASAAGDCDCSYRGCETRGLAEPLLQVLDHRRLLLPDYAGNNLFNSIGNLLEQPRIALLFVDFERQSTVLLQGLAQLAGPHPSWPAAARTIAVAVDRVQRAAVAGLPPLVPA
ncbi:pyridoxamine 5'-phosphate oxidase family protein [Comamonas guangdongensis]|uniref:Pyridoxamine 5'-phosphate oxidase family protein n=2 Tax=Comamonas guangdongensis TaxID=510515 RepID=A0ABV3ZZV4_9BURK